MPTGKGASAENSAQRTTFRPPWVKDGNDSVAQTPWGPKTVRRDSNTDGASADAGRRSSLTKNNVLQENGTNKENTFVKPKLKPVPPKDPAKLPPKENKLPPVKLNSVADRKPLTKSPSKDEEKPKIPRQESLRKVSLTPAPPPMPPPAPAFPKLETNPLTSSQLEKLEQLKSRPKTRPDWTALLKDVESGRKLKHVECNDRSKPLLPQAKAKGQFLYESEQQNAHNELLKQIQQGIHLKKVKMNDRSKPVLEGLRKFRRQMTIEEQIQKSQSMASIPPEEIIADEADEMDDIDKVRDDLQSTKQMLAIELRDKEAQIRENKRLLARIQNLEVELEKERSHTRNHGHSGPNEVDEKLIIALKIEAAEARKTTVELEKKLRETAEQLDEAKIEAENMRKQNQSLEKKLQDAAQGKRVSISEKKDGPNEKEEEVEEDEEESESESDGEENEEKRERRMQRELKLLRNKLRNSKTKEGNAKKERAALKEIMKNNQKEMKEEKKRYKSLKKEVDKMANLMKDASSDDEELDDDDDDEEDEKVEEESETETESSESETETDDSDSEKSQSEPEDAPTEKKKENLAKRAKRHENILAALKKGNFMLKTNCERLQDDLNKQKEMTQTLKEDLDSVLAELG